MNRPTPDKTLRITDPEPLGDVTLVPRQMSGTPEADLARSLADPLKDADPDKPYIPR
jgi:hypothetical protein